MLGRGIKLLFLLCALSLQGATFPQWFTTNTVAGIASPANGWLLGWTNPIPVWTLNGGSLTNLNLLQSTNNDLFISNALYSIIQSATNSLANPTNNDIATSNNLYLEIVSATNNALVLVTNNDNLIGLNGTNNSVTLSNNLQTAITNEGLFIGLGGTNNSVTLSNNLQTAITNEGLFIGSGATNNDTVVSNGVVAHTITVAGTAGRITSSTGTAQALSSNPSTTLDLATAGTAGTYTKTTFDAYGRETSGTTLQPSDITNAVTIGASFESGNAFSGDRYITIDGTRLFSSTETFERSLFNGGGPNGAWVSNLWFTIYTTNFAAVSPWGQAGSNIVVTIFTNGVATQMAMTYSTVSNPTFSVPTNLTVGPFFITNGAFWNIKLKPNVTIPGGSDFGWSITYYPQ